nr:BRO family protein [uncultured Lichenicoccus sp.]
MPVRVLNRDGAAWFVAKDVAVLLGYANPPEAVREHCKWVSETLTPSAGGPQRTKIIPESDVYRLIFRSKLPAAEAFEEWVVGTVLPAIRKDGGYVQGEELAESDEEVMARALAVATRKVERYRLERDAAQSLSLSPPPIALLAHFTAH